MIQFLVGVLVCVLAYTVGLDRVMLALDEASHEVKAQAAAAMAAVEERRARRAARGDQ